MRTHDTEMVPQLDGPVSVCSRRRIRETNQKEYENCCDT